MTHTREWRRQPFSRQTWRELRASVSDLRDAHYDAAVDFQGAVRSAVLAQLSSASQRFGFTRAREAPASMVYTRRTEGQGRHIAEQNMTLALAVAPHAQPLWEFPLPVDPDAEVWAREFLREHWSGEFYLLNPGAGWGAKCWPVERFAAVARSLASQGLRCIVNVGPGEEELASAVVEQSGGAAFAMTCALSQLMSLLRRARMCVGGDTGPTHLSAALGVPVVGIYGPTDPERNGPIGAPNIVLRHETSVTSHARRSETEAGLLNITADEVIAASRQLLAATVGRVR
jgi:heptosyltransferase-1